MKNSKVVFLAHSYPPAPQTFSADEVRVWRRCGLDVLVLAFRHLPAERQHLLPEELREEANAAAYLSSIGPAAWLRGVTPFLRQPIKAFSVALALLRGNYLRRSSVRWRLHSLFTFVRSVGVVGIAAQQDVSLVHADFADDTATAAWVAHRMTGKPYTFRDHFSYNPQLIVEKVRDASAVLTCCEANSRFLREVTGQTNAVVTSYLGINLMRWQRSDRRPSTPPVIASVGTLQEKKGQEHLVRACALLDERGLDFECLLVGDGSDRSLLESLVAELGLTRRVQITGYMPQPKVSALMRETHIMCLPSVVTRTGDIEGIPIALMEAMSLGIPCVSTATGGIAELISDGIDGLLVPERDPVRLADALESLLTDDEMVTRIGAGASRKIREAFDIEKNAESSAKILLALAK